MSDLPPNPWIYLGECPVCVNGLSRVRYCESAEHGPHVYALCDECDAYWLQPSVDADARPQFPSDEQCPICAGSLHGPQSRWALPQDIAGSDWETQAIFDVVDGDSTGDEAES